MKPKVTIIIPTLNAAAYLHQCMESVMNQTLQEIEVFVIDAASTDGTREMIEEYSRRDSRIFLFEDKKKSTGYAKNMGIESATAPYVAIVEPDDYIEPDMMEKLYETAEKNGVDFVKSNFTTFLGEGDMEMCFPKSVSADSDDYGRLVNPQEEPGCFRWIMFEWLGLYRKSFLDKYHIRHNESPGAAFQDTGFWFLTFTYAEKIYLLRDSFYHYRCDNPYASVKNPGKVFNICNEYAYIHEMLKPHEKVWNRIRPAFYRGYFYDNCVVYARIAEELKSPLLYEMRKNLLAAGQQGALDRKLYTDAEWEDLQRLLESEENFSARKSRVAFEGKKQLKILLDELSNAHSIVIYGAGSYGCNLHYLLTVNGINVSAYADGDSEKWGRTQNGIDILPLTECEEKFKKAFYLIANKHNSHDIEERLLDSGVDRARIRKCQVDKMIPVLI